MARPGWRATLGQSTHRHPYATREYMGKEYTHTVAYIHYVTLHHITSHHHVTWHYITYVHTYVHPRTSTALKLRAVELRAPSARRPSGSGRANLRDGPPGINYVMFCVATGWSRRFARPLRERSLHVWLWDSWRACVRTRTHARTRTNKFNWYCFLNLHVLWMSNVFPFWICIEF